MPYGPGSYGPDMMGGGGLAASATARQGISQPGIVPSAPPAPDQETLSQVIQMLRGGQAGADGLMELLSLLAASTVPTMDGGAPAGMPPGMEGMAPAPQQGGRGTSIQDLLG